MAKKNYRRSSANYKKKKRLAQSQAAHRRLRDKYRDGDTATSQLKYIYHQSVAAEQSERKRILSRSEKVSFWRRALNYFRGLRRKEKSGAMVNRSRAQYNRSPKKTVHPGNDFDYDSRGRIKGSYIDGRFEPD